MNKPDAPKNRAPLHKRSIVITLTPAKAVTGTIFLVVAIVWFFIMGLILGRGYEPEKDIPALAKVMPKNNASTKKEALDVISGGNAATTLSATTDKSGRAVIAEADATYRKSISLKKENNATETATQAKTTAVKAPQAAVQEKKPQEKKKEEELFDYQYQIASFKDNPGAAALAQKLKADGIKARVSETTNNNKKWYRVVVDYRSSPDGTNQLRTQLKRHKIDKILLINKKPVKK